MSLPAARAPAERSRTRVLNRVPSSAAPPATPTMRPSLPTSTTTSAASATDHATTHLSFEMIATGHHQPQSRRVSIEQTPLTPCHPPLRAGGHGYRDALTLARCVRIS
jgi:hypothetical protein